MPTYEYQCKACSHRFERFQKVSDPAPTECPECKQGPIQKIFTSVGIIFKGSGFHVNDYRKSEPKPEGGDAPAAEKPAAEKPAAADSKPAAETPAAPAAAADTSNSSPKPEAPKA